jgi:hypothetical protein
MAECYSSYLVPEKVLSSNPLVSRWKALSQSLVGTTSLIPICYHKSHELKPRKWKHNFIMCHKALLVDITISIPICYHKSHEFKPRKWKHNFIMCHKALLVDITISIPICYHKSHEFKPRRWKHNFIMCHKALLVDITISIPIWYPQKCWVSNPLMSRWKKTLLWPLPQGLTWCHVLYHKAWLEVQPTACQSILLVWSKRKRKTLDVQSRFFFSNLKKFYLPINHNHMQKKHMKF